MSKIYTITEDRGFTKIKFLAKPAYDDIVGIIDEIAEHYPYERRLWDLSEIEFDLTAQELQAIALYGKGKFPLPNKMAFLTDNDLIFGELRMFEGYRAHDQITTMQVFRKNDEAEAWLRE